MGVQWLRLALSKGPNRVGVSLHLRTETDPISETSCFFSSNYLESGRWTKSENPIILCVVFLHFNTASSTKKVKYSQTRIKYYIQHALQLLNISKVYLIIHYRYRQACMYVWRAVAMRTCLTIAAPYIEVCSTQTGRKNLELKIHVVFVWNANTLTLPTYNSQLRCIISSRQTAGRVLQWWYLLPGCEYSTHLSRSYIQISTEALQYKTSM
jgi:hypothetical protein